LQPERWFQNTKKDVNFLQHKCKRGAIVPLHKTKGKRKENVMLETLEAMKKFSLLSTDEMYDEFEVCERLVNKKEEKLKEIIKLSGIDVTINYDRNLCNMFKARNSFYMNITRLYPNDKGRHLVWYKMRDNINQYYTLKNSKFVTYKGIDSVKIHGYFYSFMIKEFNLELLKEYKNGHHVYSVSEDYLKAVYLVNQITNNMEGV